LGEFRYFLLVNYIVTFESDITF